jgi:hypothetical protein
MCWKIETFHKILKSGCRAEESRLRTAQRLTNLIAVYCIMGWRVFWLTMMSHFLPAASPTMAFMALEIHLLDRLVKDTGTRRTQRKSLAATSPNSPDWAARKRNRTLAQILQCSIYKHYFDGVMAKNLEVQETAVPYSATLSDYKSFLKIPSTTLLRRRSTLLGKEANLFTTNIDVFIEKARSSARFAANE